MSIDIIIMNKNENFKHPLIWRNASCKAELHKIFFDMALDY